MIATRESPGTPSFRYSSRLALSSGEMPVRPAIFPPGCARLATNPVPTGSVLEAITIGIEPRLSLDRCYRYIRGRDDGGYIKAYQFGGDLGYSARACSAETAFHDDVLSFDITELAQPLLERLDELRRRSRSAWMENAYVWNLSAGLRVRGGERAYEQRTRRGADKSTPVHQ